MARRRQHTREQVETMFDLAHARAAYEVALEALAEAAWKAQEAGIARYEVMEATGLTRQQYTKAFAERVWQHIEKQDYLEPENQRMHF